MPDPNACALAAIAFIRGKQRAAVPAPGGQMKITEVMIVATQTPYGWQRVAGLVQYTAIFEKLTRRNLSTKRQRNTMIPAAPGS